MIKYNKTLRAAVVVLSIFGGTLIEVNTVQAKTTYQRTVIKSVKSTPMYSTSNKGKTYAFKGDAKKFTFKASHKLKNYHNSTWTKSKQTTVKHGKNSSTYYFVKNAKNGVTGWVNKVYMKTGKDYQYGATKNLTAKRYIEKSIGKIYNLDGNPQYFKFKSVANLSNTANYTVTAQRRVYKKGKTAIYYYVSGDNGTKGWIWRGYLKSGQHAVNGDTANNATTSSSSASGFTSAADSWKNFQAENDAKNPDSSGKRVRELLKENDDRTANMTAAQLAKYVKDGYNKPASWLVTE